MGIEKIGQASSINEGDRARLAAMEEEQGHNHYTEIFDDIERDPLKVQTIIARALMEKAVTEKAFSNAMNAAGQNNDEAEVTESAKEISDVLLEKMRSKTND